MARLNVPEGFEPSGKTETEIRENIKNIPVILMISFSSNLEAFSQLQLAWWEEIALQQKDIDEEAAYKENDIRNKTV